MSDTRVYREPNPISHRELLTALNSGSTEKAQAALVSLTFHEEDFDYVFSIILHCINNDSPDLKATAIICLGHLARLHGTIPVEPTLSIIKAGLRDPNQKIRGHSTDAMDDIKMFVPAVGNLF